MSGTLGNYVSENPSNLRNFMSADTLNISWAAYAVTNSDCRYLTESLERVLGVMGYKAKRGPKSSLLLSFRWRRREPMLADVILAAIRCRGDVRAVVRTHHVRSGGGPQ